MLSILFGGGANGRAAVPWAFGAAFMRPAKLAAFVILALGFSVGGGCPGGLPGMGIGGEGSGSGGEGRLSMLVTDAPYPFEYIAEAWISIERIEVRRGNEDEGADADDESNDPTQSGMSPNADAAPDQDDSQGADEGESSLDEPKGGEDETSDDPEDESEEFDDADDDGDQSGEAGDDDPHDGESAEDEGEEGSPFVVVFEAGEQGPREFNLVELRNGRVDTLFSAELLPAGRYTQVRVVVSAGHVVLTDGREFPLRVPSGDRSGIKLRTDFEVGDGQETVLLLDVDLSRAFKPIPGSGAKRPEDIREFKFAPSLAMTVTEVAASGSISGVVTDAEGAPAAGVPVSVFAAADEAGAEGGEAAEPVAQTVTEVDGTYALLGLSAGVYTLQFGDETVVENVEVAAGEDVVVNAALPAEGG